MKFGDGGLQPAKRYKLFTDRLLRRVVLARLVKDHVKCGAVLPGAKACLCLAIGKVASATDCDELRRHAAAEGWRLLESSWLSEGVRSLATQGYENDVAHIVAKILLRGRSEG